MKRPEDNNWLDEALTNAIGSERSTTDFDKWKEDHPQAVEMLTSRAKASPQATTRPLRTWSTIMRNRNLRYSAAAAVIVIAAIIGLPAFLGGTLTFATVVEPILNARTIVFDLVLGNDENGIVMHEEVTGPLIRRTISNMPGLVLILDLDANKMLALNTVGKTAGYVALGQVGDKTENYIESVRKIIIDVQNKPDIEKLAECEIDGKTAIGFRGGNDNEKLTIWADPETALVIRVELEIGRMRVVFKNFEFDPEIEEPSMEVPAGYTLDKTQVDLSDASEQDLVESLRTWAQFLLDGTFPDTIGTEDYMREMAVLGQKLPTLDIPDSEKEQVGLTFAKGMIFLQKSEMGGKWRYVGKGVKLGDADKAILWYQPEGSKTYRVIYGDLNVADVSAENLPK